MKILIAGDFCPQHRVAAIFEKEKYELVLSEVQSVISETNYSIVNLECPIVTSSAIPIEKKGPNLHCTPNVVNALKYAGFNCVTLANNHFRDYGDDGIFETLSNLDACGIDHVGGDVDATKANNVLYKSIENQTLAIINCCEHEFSIASSTQAGSNPLNPVQQYYTICEARQNADYVLVIVHGGHEHFQLPSPRMVETYRFFVDAGADAVVNHHQHCFSGYEVYKGKPIFYGLGNFCFDRKDMQNGIWTEGYMIIFDFFDSNISFNLRPYRQCAINPNIELLPKNAFDTQLTKLNAIIADREILNDAIYNYFTSNGEQHSNIFEPIMNRYYLAAKHRGWLPSLLSKKRRLAATNYILCEAHRDILIHWLNKQN